MYTTVISLSKISILLNEATHILHETIYKIKNNIELLDYNEKLDRIMSKLKILLHIHMLLTTTGSFLITYQAMNKVYKIKKYLQYMSNKYQKPKFTLEDDVNIH
jgi:hypothetical protein